MNGEAPGVPVSVIIPCYQCVKTIQRAVDSILGQTIRPAELVLVDDCSGDDTLDILRGLAGQHENWIRVVSLTKNSGAATARNTGWAACTQKYVAFLDADDCWHESKLEKQFTYMEGNADVAMCVHLHRVVNEPLCPLNWPLPSGRGYRVTSPRILLKNSFITPSIMVRNTLPIRFRSDQRYMEDQFFLYETVCDGHRIDELRLELAAIYKPAFGAGGLSANLWAMERGELNNYHRLLQTGRLGLISTCFLMVVSLIKFARRLFQVKVWRRIASA